MVELALDLTNPDFIKGFLAFAAMFIVFIGSAWLLLAMILGPKLGYFVTAACFFGVMVILSAIWFVTGLGPKGEQGFIGDLGVETAWEVVAAGPDLGRVESEIGEFDVSDYPNGWVTPSRNRRLADLSGDDSTLSEVANTRPVMEALILDAVSEIPGKRKDVAPHLEGEIRLETENFETTDIKMKETQVKGKDSIIAVGRAVPSRNLMSGDLGGAEEATVSKFLAEESDQINPGDPIMEVTVDGRTMVLNADSPGRLIDFGFRLKDKVKPDVPIATVDISGQPGAPPPVEVLAARVRGSEKVPAFIYLVASTVLLLVHLAGVSRVERRQKAVPQPA